MVTFPHDLTKLIIGNLQIAVKGANQLQRKPRKVRRLRTLLYTDPISLSFSNNWKRLLLLHDVSGPSRFVTNRKDELEIHDFDHDELWNTQLFGDVLIDGPNDFVSFRVITRD